MRYLEGNVAVAKFSVATNENYKDKNGEWQTNTEWHEIVAWRGLAERAEKQFHKGSQVFVEGKLTHRKYQDKEGNDKYITEVVANSLRLLERREPKAEGSFNQGDAANDTPAVKGPSEPSGQQKADDDLPF